MKVRIHEKYPLQGLKGAQCETFPDHSRHFWQTITTKVESSASESTVARVGTWVWEGRDEGQRRELQEGHWCRGDRAASPCPELCLHLGAGIHSPRGCGRRGSDLLGGRQGVVGRSRETPVWSGQCCDDQAHIWRASTTENFLQLWRLKGHDQGVAALVSPCGFQAVFPPSLAQSPLWARSLPGSAARGAFLMRTPLGLNQDPPSSTSSLQRPWPQHSPLLRFLGLGL